MKTTSRTRTTHTYTVPGPNIEVELPVEPSGAMSYKDAIISLDLVTGQIHVGYLADDRDCANPLEDDAYAGQIYEARRHGPTLRQYEEARAVGPCEGQKPDPYHVLLDVYEHGGISYSLNGEGQQCQFDTARAGALWVPSDELRKELDALPKDQVQARARELAKSAAEQYTAWRNGDCYVVVVVTYDKDGAQLDWDSVGGYIGADAAYAELKSQMEPT